MELETYNEVKSYLYGLKTQGKKDGIDRMLLLSKALDYPERRFPIIHVAGTNGKGSTCAMLEAIYRTAGLRVGMYTSPHLVFLGERIQINRKILSFEKIIEYTNRLKSIVDAIIRKDPSDAPSLFEFMTAMAFLHFENEKVDICILETGLGGRLDSTNVVLPELSIITSISLDHCEFLGDTFALIAKEKAAIIKPGKPAVIGCLPSEAETVARAYAQKQKSPVYSIREHFGDDEQRYPKTNLFGNYQRRNAAIASLSAHILQSRFPVNDTTIQQALLNIDWAGRWDEQTLADNKKLILDASHNPEGADFLAQSLEAQTQKDKRRPIILVGVLGIVRAKILMATVCRFTDQIFLLCPKQSRACSFQELEAAIPDHYSGEVHRAEVKELFPKSKFCAIGEKGSTLVVTGSIYLIGEVLEAISSDIPAGEQSLQDTL